MIPPEPRLTAALGDRYRRGVQVLGLPPDQLMAYVDGVERPASRATAAQAVDEMAARGQFPLVILARLYAVLGERERALSLLERAVEQRAPFTTYIGRWVDLHSLADEPRFRAVLRRVGLPNPGPAARGP